MPAVAGTADAPMPLCTAVNASASARTCGDTGAGCVLPPFTAAQQSPRAKSDAGELFPT